MPETPVRISQPLERRVFSPESVADVVGKLELRARYDREITPRRESVKSLGAAANLIKAVRSEMMPVGRTDDSSGEKSKAKLIKLAAKAGVDPKRAEEVLFGSTEGQADIQPGLIKSARDYLNSQGNNADLSRRNYEINQGIAHMCDVLFAGRTDLSSVLSSEKSIPIRTKNGEMMVSPRDLFMQNPEAAISRAVDFQKAAVDVLLSDPELAVFDAFNWVNDVNRQVIERKLDIFPTPDTEAVKDRIRLAQQKRNGLLKYVLYGEAGVGKTRIIQEMDKEMGMDGTVVISFHHFIDFEEMIGRTATTVDLGGGSPEEQFSRLVTRFVDSSPSTPDFWKDMSAVYENLPVNIKSNYSSVEEMVKNYGANLIPKTSEATVKTEPQGREEIMQDFQTRIKSLKDMMLLGFVNPQSKDLQSRYVFGVLTNIIKHFPEKKVVPMFDEMDKAGPYAIEGLLSFLSMEAGKEWNFQGGSLMIPEDFYVAATSNKTNIGSLTDSEGMNRYLADRTEGILVKPQSVKGSLMIAAGHLMDGRGNLLLDSKDQVNLVNAFSYVIPRLQEMNLPIPVTNRVIKTICSRLVDFDRTSDEGVRYFRVLNSGGEPGSVYQALELSVLTMKEMALGEKSGDVVRVLSEYSQLLGEGRVEDLGEQMSWYDPKAEEKSLEPIREGLETVWDQPLYQAIAKLQPQIQPVEGVRLQRADAKLLNIPNLNQVLADTEPLDVKLIGRGNGITLEGSAQGITMKATSGDGEVLGEKKVVNGDYTGAAIKAADQTGEVFVVARNSGSSIYEVVSKGHKSELDVAEDSQIIVDPHGRYVITAGDQGLSLSSIDDNKIVRKLDLVAGNARVLDISADGGGIIFKDQAGIHFIDLSKQELPGTSSPLVVDINLPGWEQAAFAGGRVIVGKNSLNTLAANPSNGRVEIIKLAA